MYFFALPEIPVHDHVAQALGHLMMQRLPTDRRFALPWLPQRRAPSAGFLTDRFHITLLARRNLRRSEIVTP